MVRRSSDVDPAAIAGTGRGGRITKGDVLRHLEPAPPAAPGRGSRPLPASPLRRPSSRLGEPPARHGRRARRPGSRCRRCASASPSAWSRSSSTAAILTTFNEVDMSAVIELRARAARRPSRSKHGVGLGFMSFFVKAAVDALRGVSRRSTPRSTANEIVYQPLLRHRHRRQHRARPGGAGAARRRPADASPRSRRRSPTSPRKARDRTIDPRELPGGTSRSPTAASSARCSRRRSSTRRRPASSACTRSRSGRWSWTTRS